MRALSIRQPWAWFIVHGTKNYENRQWDDRYLRSQLAACPIGSDFQIHASSSMTKREYEEACEFASERCGVTMIPRIGELRLGGIIGIVRLDGVVRSSSSPWFTGRIALRLSDPLPVPFHPCKGALGFFELEP